MCELLLDSYQQVFIDHEHIEDEVMLLPATAGAGKSTTILAKIAKIITAAEDPAEQAKRILATTFSNKAAKDLIGKFRSTYPDLPVPNISTLHSFGLQLIKNDGIKPIILNTWNSILLARSIIDGLHIYPDDTRKSVTTKTAEAVIDTIGIIKATNSFNLEEFNLDTFSVEPYLYGSELDDDTREIVVRHFNAIILEYENRKIRDHLFDFDDLIYQANQILDFNLTLLEDTRNSLDYVFIDEAQDCDTAQFHLFFRLSAHKRLTLVFDRCQTLYKFRQSAPELLDNHNLKQYFNTITELPLLFNYRSTENIVKIGNILREAAEDKYQSQPFRENIKGSVKLKVCRNNIQEGDVIVDTIQDYIKEGYDLGDITIISRGNWYLKTIVEPALVRRNIPYMYAAKNSGKKLNEKNINRLYFSMISFILNPADYTAVLNMAQYVRGIGDAFLQRLEAFYFSNGVKNIATSGCFTTKSDLAKGKELDLMLIELSDLSKDINLMTIASLLDDLRTLVFKFMNLPCAFEELQMIEGAIANWVNFYIDAGKCNLTDILETILLEINNFDVTSDKNVVKLSTIHQTKGLSLPVTICGGFTSALSFRNDFNDEQYMIYVQMSRAIDKLAIIYSLEYITRSNKTMDSVVNPYLNYLLDKIKKIH